MIYKESHVCTIFGCCIIIRRKLILKIKHFQMVMVTNLMVSIYGFIVKHQVNK